MNIGELCLESSSSATSKNEDFYEHIKIVGRGLDDKLHELNRSILEAETNLRKSQNVLRNEEELQNELLRCIESIQHKVWRAKHLVVTKVSLQQKLSHELENIVHKSLELEMMLKSKDMEFTRIRRENQLYMDKIISREMELEKYFDEGEEAKELKKAQERLVKLLEMKNNPESSDNFSYFGSSSSCNNFYSKKLNAEELAFLISEEEVKQADLKQIIEVLNKKNAAKRTRLIKQHRAELNNQKKWEEKASLLQSKIQALRDEVAVYRN